MDFNAINLKQYRLKWEQDNPDYPLWHAHATGQDGTLYDYSVMWRNDPGTSQTTCNPDEGHWEASAGDDSGGQIANNLRRCFAR